MCAANDIIYVCYFLHVMSDINRETTAPEDPNAAAAVVLPNDPLDWTNDHIAAWLKWCGKHLELWPIPKSDDFPNTGYNLCSLDRAEFDRRSRNRRSGRLLLLHLSLLRQPVTGTPPSPSLTTPEDAVDWPTEILEKFPVGRSSC